MVKEYTVETGLPTANIRQMLEDSDGYIWLGSEEGLLRFDGYTFDQFTDDGAAERRLMDNRVGLLYQDRNSVLWIGTAQALHRYNKSIGSFSYFTVGMGSSADIHGRELVGMFETRDGLLWVVTDFSLHVFSPATDRFLNIALSTDRPVGISAGFSFLEIDREVWICISGTLVRYDRHTEAITIFDATDIDSSLRRFSPFLAIAHEGPGAILLVNIHGLYRYHIQTGRTVILERFTSPAISVSMHRHALWLLLSNTRAYHWDTRARTGSTIRLLPEESSNRMLPPFNGEGDRFFRSPTLLDRAGNFWALIPGTALVFRSAEKGRVQTLASALISRMVVGKILEDRSGSIWVVSPGAGLLQIERRQRRFESLGRKKPAHSASVEQWDNVRGISLWGGDSLLINTLSGMFLYDRNRKQVRDFSLLPSKYSLLSSFPSWSSVRDDAGRLWIGTGGMGLVMLDLPKQRSLEFSVSGSEKTYIPDRRIRSLLLSSDNTLWVATWTGITSISLDGFNSRDSTSIRMKSYRHDAADSSSLSNDLVFFLFEDKQKRLWIGTENGLNLFVPETKNFKRYLFRDSERINFRSNDVRAMMQDRAGTLWIGTHGGGLNRFHPESGSVERITQHDGLPSDIVYSIAEDDKKRLWFGTHRGLCRFDPHTGDLRVYGESDGLPNYEFNTGSVLKLADGSLAFGSVGGFTVFQPGSILDLLPPAKAVISRILFYDKSDPWVSDTILLSHEQNYIGFEFSALSSFRAQDNQYAYHLEGVDPDWVYSGSIRFARYTRLEPGTYVFRVKASNCDGVWSTIPAKVVVIIESPWWKTTWAYIGYAILFLLAIFIADRLQRRRLQLRERNRSKIREAQLRAQTAEAEAQTLILENQWKALELEKATELREAYEKLQQTQEQLVHAEKLATLGELTAGIAHELKNPLNFINNFAAVASEFLEEMVQHLKSGAPADTEIESLRQAQTKIQEHGKRADRIIERMLLHARGRKGDYKLCDLNSVVEEALNLAYNGMKALHPEMQVSIELELDPSLPSVEIIPEDISSVLINLLNNAFYALENRRRSDPELSTTAMVWLSTNTVGDSVAIEVRDNGPGVPDEIREKVFHPFFTTKPPGEGTGLGLSLSYDVIQAHHGEIGFESSKEQGTRFTIILPKVREWKKQ